MRVPRHDIYWECIASQYLEIIDIARFDQAAINHQIRWNLCLPSPPRHICASRCLRWESDQKRHTNHRFEGHCSRDVLIRDVSDDSDSFLGLDININVESSISVSVNESMPPTQLNDPYRRSNKANVIVQYISYIWSIFRQIFLFIYQHIRRTVQRRRNGDQTSPEMGLDEDLEQFIRRTDESDSEDDSFISPKSSWYDRVMRYLLGEADPIDNGNYIDSFQTYGSRLHLNHMVAITSLEMINWCEKRHIVLCNVKLRYGDQKYKNIKYSSPSLSPPNIAMVLTKRAKQYLSYILSLCCDCFLPGENSFYRKEIPLESISSNGLDSLNPGDLISHIETLDIDNIDMYPNIGPHLLQLNSLTLYGQLETETQQYLFSRVLSQIQRNALRGIYLREIHLFRQHGLFLSRTHLEELIVDCKSIEVVRFVGSITTLQDRHMQLIAQNWRHLNSMEIFDSYITENSLSNFRSTIGAMGDDVAAQRSTHEISSNLQSNPSRTNTAMSLSLSQDGGFRFKKLSFTYCSKISARRGLISLLHRNPSSSMTLSSLTLRVSPFTDSEDGLSSLLQLCPNLTYVHIYTFLMYEVVSIVCRHCPGIRHIILSDTRNRDIPSYEEFRFDYDSFNYSRPSQSESILRSQSMHIGRVSVIGSSNTIKLWDCSDIFSCRYIETLDLKGYNYIMLLMNDLRMICDHFRHSLVFIGCLLYGKDELNRDIAEDDVKGLFQICERRVTVDIDIMQDNS